MSRLLSFVFATAACTAAQAAPTVFTELQRIEYPSAYAGAVLENVALDGDRMLIMANAGERHALLAYERGADDVWRHVQTVKDVQESFGTGLALRGDVAASDIDGYQIFEHVDGLWQERGDFGPVNGAPFAISGATVLATTANCEAQLYPRSSSGIWLESSLLPGARNVQCFDPWFDIDGDLAVAANRPETTSPIEPRVYRRAASGSWQAGPALAYPPGATAAGSQVSMRDARIAGKVLPSEGGDVVWAQDSSGGWSLRGRLQAADAFETRDGDSAHLIAVGGEPDRRYYQLGNLTDSDRHGHGAVRVFSEQPGGEFVHLATLRTRDGTPITGPMSASGVSVVAGGGNDAANPRHAYFFRVQSEYPLPVAAIQENFENGAPANWRATTGSQFSVVGEGVTHVFRQANESRSVGAEYTGRSWGDSAIEADIVPRHFAGPGRWVGLMTRRLDGNNFYYVALQPPDIISFRRIKAGVTTVLQSWSTSGHVAVAPGLRHRLRLESLGDRHRIYVDGVLMAYVIDDELVSGRVGLVMQEASADYDNVIMTGGTAMTLRHQLFSHSTQRPSDSWWTNTGPGQWVTAADFSSVTQTSTVGNTRRVTGAVATDQIITVRARPQAFGPAPADPAFSVIGRYVDNGNYYVLSLHDNNRVRLRKQLANFPVELAGAALDVAPNRDYELKLEVVGNQLRGYVDNQLVVEATDDSFARGTYGLATTRTSVRFSEFHVYQP